jgi:hypothetical protein
MYKSYSCLISINRKNYFLKKFQPALIFKARIMIRSELAIGTRADGNGDKMGMSAMSFDTDDDDNDDADCFERK